MKFLSFPKKELPGALLATQLSEKVLQPLTRSPERVFWRPDSTTLLQWLNSVHKQPILIVKRVCEVQKFSTVDQWPYTTIQETLLTKGCRNLVIDSTGLVAYDSVNFF